LERGVWGTAGEEIEQEVWGLLENAIEDGVTFHGAIFRGSGCANASLEAIISAIVYNKPKHSRPEDPYGQRQNWLKIT
jgi:hypothetical protein